MHGWLTHWLVQLGSLFVISMDSTTYLHLDHLLLAFFKSNKEKNVGLLFEEVIYCSYLLHCSQWRIPLLYNVHSLPQELGGDQNTKCNEAGKLGTGDLKTGLHITYHTHISDPLNRTGAIHHAYSIFLVNARQATSTKIIYLFTVATWLRTLHANSSWAVSANFVSLKLSGWYFNLNW